MAILFAQKVYGAGVSGATTVYTDPALNSVLANAEKWFVQLRLSMATGTSQSVSVSSETSSDGVAWNTKAILVSATPVSAGAIATGWGGDNSGGTLAIAGRYLRLAIVMTGTSPSANVEVWITGRTNS